MQHTAHVVITTFQGTIGAHFSQYFGQNTFPVPVPTDPDGGFAFVDFPIGSNYTKLMARDDQFGPPITHGNGWNQQVQINGPGIFILDLSDWNDDPNGTSVQVMIDGQVIWQAQTNYSKDNYKDWQIAIRAQNVRITDDREIAIDVTS